jgi:hypothetical protein
MEGDTFPLGGDPQLSQFRDPDDASDPWVIGARVHPWSRQHLAPFLHDHVNGHAAYLLCDEFVAFLEYVWVPSLLILLRRHSGFAFDCITPQVVEEELPASLQRDWEDNFHRFSTVPTFVNASNLRVSNITKLQALLHAHLSDGRTNPECIDASDLVSVHVKGYPTILDDIDALWPSIDKGGLSYSGRA